MSMDSKKFVSDLNVRPELVGSPAALSPFLQFISSQRGLNNIGRYYSNVVVKSTF